MTIYEHNPRNVPASASRWTPVLKGDGYCSPACGGKCKKTAYDYAVQAADELAARLGQGWQPHVWENLGWHFRVSKADSDVRFSRGTFDATIRVGDDITFSASDSDPRQALQRALSELSALQKRVDRALASLTLTPLALPTGEVQPEAATAAGC